jgi:UDP-N-acetylglucosamine 2-epimerase (non-hydrolysing)
MPEEHNRVIIDHIPELLFATNDKARQNLEADGARGTIVVTGDPIVDATAENLEIARRSSGVPESLGLERGRYLVATVHREENVDDPDALANILAGLRLLTRELRRPIVFATHPRTRKRLVEFGLGEEATAVPDLVLTEALGYLDFLSLMDSAALVLTDSGGVQQESCILGIPVVTLHENTEWTETVTLGANMLAGTNPESILGAAGAMLGRGRDWPSPFGDGRAATRIVDVAKAVLRGDGEPVVPTPGSEAPFASQAERG